MYSKVTFKRATLLVAVFLASLNAHVLSLKKAAPFAEGSQLDGLSEPDEFEYFHGGDDWTLDVCKHGKRQSPIDLPFFEEDIVSPMPRDYFTSPTTRRFLSNKDDETLTEITEDETIKHDHIFEPLPILSFDANYGEIADVQVKNLRDSVWVDIRHIDGDFVVHEANREDEVFHPQQFHFHSPSEHTIDGRHYDLEMHFYHETEDRTHHSVIAIFFDRKAGGSEENEFIKNLFTTPSGEELSEEDVNEKESWIPAGVHLEQLLLKLDRTKLFHYEGSLTVPPCTENVEWNIIDDPQPISEEQLAMFKNKWEYNEEFAGGRGNNRRTQPLLARHIFYLAGEYFGKAVALASAALSLIALSI